MDEVADGLAWPAPGSVYSSNEFDNLVRGHTANVSRMFRENSSVIATRALNLLELLDPALNSYSYLALLDALLPSTSDVLQQCDLAIVDRVTTFLLTFDARQVRFAGSMFSNLLKRVSSGRLMPANIAVHVLAQALLRIDPTGTMLTSHHLHLVNLAYQTDNVVPALPIITKNIIFYPDMANQKEPQKLSDPTLTPPSYISKDTGLTANLRPHDVLEYEFIVGLMFCSVRAWTLARDAFARAASYPGRDNGVSKIAVDAHKRWVLISLLIDGKTTSRCPAHTSSSAARYYGSLNMAYLALADCFNVMSASQLKREVENSQATFAEDKTEGLVGEVVRAHQKWQIAQLRDVYVKISIADIRASTSSAMSGEPLTNDVSVEELIQGMISSGMVKAAIHKPAGAPAYLEFFADGDVSEAEYAVQIAQTAKNISAMQPLMRATKERMATHRDHIKHLQKELKRGDNERIDAGFEESIEDEDLMTGINQTGVTLGMV